MISYVLKKNVSVLDNFRLGEGNGKWVWGPTIHNQVYDIQGKEIKWSYSEEGSKFWIWMRKPKSFELGVLKQKRDRLLISHNPGTWTEFDVGGRPLSYCVTEGDLTFGVLVINSAKLLLKVYDV